MQAERPPLFPWGARLQTIIATTHPSPILGDRLVIATDSGGTDHQSRYRVNAYLCVEGASGRRWDEHRMALRKKYLSDGRRLAYKSLSDRYRSAALVPFLNAALELRGICFVLIVNKSIKHLCLDDPLFDLLKRRLAGNWKRVELEEAARSTYVMSLLM